MNFIKSNINTTIILCWPTLQLVAKMFYDFTTKYHSYNSLRYFKRYLKYTSNGSFLYCFYIGSKIIFGERKIEDQYGDNDDAVDANANVDANHDKVMINKEKNLFTQALISLLVGVSLLNIISL